MIINDTKLKDWRAKYPTFDEVLKSELEHGREYGTDQAGYLTLAGSESVYFPIFVKGDEPALDELFIDNARAVHLKDVKNGDFIRRTPDARIIYRKTSGSYDRITKKYWLEPWEDAVKDIAVKGDAVVYIDFGY